MNQDWRGSGELRRPASCDAAPWKCDESTCTVLSTATKTFHVKNVEYKRIKKKQY